MLSPTALLLDALKASWLSTEVERWIPQVNRKRDLFGLGDGHRSRPGATPGSHSVGAR